MSTSLKIFLGFLVLLLLGGGFFYFGYAKKKTQSGGSQPTSSPSKKTALDMNPNGPYYHEIYFAISKNGLLWEKQNKLLFDHASVPGAVIRDGIIYVYFVDMGGDAPQLSVGISKDLGQTYEKKKVEISGIESAGAVDPHPEVLENGQIRLFYFYSTVQNMDPAKAQDKHKFYSATSKDGIEFKNPQLVYEDYEITDPDVFRTADDWRMFVSKGKKMDLLISGDGLSFQKKADFDWNKGSVSDTFNFNGTFRTFYCGEGIQSAAGGDAGRLTSEEGARVSEEGKIVCDPTVIQLPDGSYLMFYKVQKNMPQENQGPENQPPVSQPRR